MCTTTPVFFYHVSVKEESREKKTFHNHHRHCHICLSSRRRKASTGLSLIFLARLRNTFSFLFSTFLSPDSHCAFKKYINCICLKQVWLVVSAKKWIRIHPCYTKITIVCQVSIEKKEKRRSDNVLKVEGKNKTFTIQEIAESIFRYFVECTYVTQSRKFHFFSSLSTITLFMYSFPKYL